MDQWTSVLAKFFSQHSDTIKIGNLGGSDDIQAITVSTYDSAYLRAPNLGNRFALVIFDEVHHLAPPGYRSIANNSLLRFVWDSLLQLKEKMTCIKICQDLLVV